MSEKVKYILNAGAIIGLANGLLPMFGFIILAVGLFFAIKKYRTDHMEGFMTYGQVFKIGYRLSALAGVIVAFSYYLRFLLQPDVIQKSFDEALGLLERIGYPQSTLAMMQDQLSPQLFAFSSFFNTILLGLIVSIILGFILKKEPSTPQQL